MDRLTPERRSWLMSRVGSKNTKPELAVRSLLHALGYRFRLHRRDLPGTPDIVLPRRNAVVFVHGCFWHGHACKRGKMPKSRQDYWDAKIYANRRRDAKKIRMLRALDWRVIIVWECDLKNAARLSDRLVHTIEGRRSCGAVEEKPESLLGNNR